jgi:hypothetical protein
MAFQPGQSGNPGGRPKEGAELRAAARQHTQAALEAIVAGLADNDMRIRLKAAELILDRGYGKAPQSMTVAGDETAPLITRIERVIVHATDKDGPGI